MKTEIVYDGHITERRAGILKNLASIVLDEGIYRNIREAENAVTLKEGIKKIAETENIKSHVFLDIKLGNIIYPIVAVGDYGIAVTIKEPNPIFKPNQLVHVVKSVQDIANLKLPWIGHPMKGYEEFVLANQQAPTNADLIGVSYPIDMGMLSTSTLWQDLQLKRDMLAEKKGLEPSMVYKLKDVYDMICMYPTDIIYTSPILVEYQLMILKDWRRFLYQEGMSA